MNSFFLKLTFCLLFILVLNLSVSSPSSSQSLNPLETQPSDFGEANKSNQKIEQTTVQNSIEEKPVLSEMEAFIARAKELLKENAEKNIRIND